MMRTRIGFLLVMMMLVNSIGISSAQVSTDFDSAKWHDSFCYGEEICLVGQFNGIGGDDIVAFVRSSKGTDADGDVWVALASGDRFAEERVWHASFCYGEEVCQVGDFDGDGRDDIIAFVRSSKGNDADGDVWVAVSDGHDFVDARVWHDSFCYGAEACLIGDFNGDGKDDIAAATGPANNGQQADVWVALSTGSGFDTPRVWGKISGCRLLSGEYSCMTGDFDGDGQDDIVSNDWQTHIVWVVTSTGSRFEAEQVWQESTGKIPREDYPYFCNLGGQTCAVGDYDNDGQDDIFTFARDTIADYAAGIFINKSLGEPHEKSDVYHEESGFHATGVLAADAFCVEGAMCRIGDFNNDGFADVITFYRSLYPDDTLDGDIWVALNRHRNR